MYEDDIDYAAKRLNNTLVRLENGDPYFVYDTSFNGVGGLCHRGQNLVTGIDLSVEHTTLNLEPVPLGFINTKSSMVYVCRKPMRRDWKQGLSHNSLMTYGHLSPRDINFKMLVQPVTQQYPSFKQALKALEKKDSLAFSRDFGLSRKEKVLLVYKQYSVGEIRDELPILDPSKFFLEQYLADVMERKVEN